MADVQVAEDEDVVYEEIPQPQVIETGDSVKVKQVLDDATMDIIVKEGHEADYSWDNLKLLLMFVACVFALVAQFYPLPFPESRPILGVCCAVYFIISAVLQLIVSYVDKDTIMFTKPNAVFPGVMRIRTAFPRFQEFFTLIIQFKDPDSPCSTAKMYVGKYFTVNGEFDEEAFAKDVKVHLGAFLNKDYSEIEYNHKTKSE